ncbi:MAG: hypothetical protein K2L14_05370 [Duncaniella sp.]|nr:hypothetical protein [Duncaniella sp.]
MKISAFTILSSLAIILPACSEVDNQPAPLPAVCPVEWESVPLSSIDAHNIDKANGFALDLFKKSFAAEPENLCLSPVSVFAALAMSANGDNGAARNNVLDVLGYGHDGLSELNIYCNALLTETRSLNGTTDCEYANSLWYSPDVAINPVFASNIKNIFDADIFRTTLSDMNGMKEINRYISDHTHGLIPEFLTSPLDIRVAMINTTYFKGAWKEAFDKNLTARGSFRNLDGSVSDAQYMHREGKIDYAATDGIQSIRLPYLGDRFTMTIIMPEAEGDFDSMLSQLSAASLRNLDSQYKSTEALIGIPRFEASVSLELLDRLNEMGLNNKGFNGISENESFFIVTVRHGVRLIVDEEGTEAAGATMVGVENACPNFIIFENPFIYIIRDTISDTILFIGAVTKF